jgi:hypothetical protein
VDIVYICRKGENEELRYSLRSVVKNLPESRVWVVGYKPDWYVGDFIYVEDKSTKFNNIRSALSAAAKHPEVSNNFVYMNDDFFLIKPVEKLNTYDGGLLSDKIARYRQVNPTSGYAISLKKTMEHLKNLGVKNPIDYDIHVPMIFNKEKLAEIAYMPFQTRSIYGNLYQIASETITDVKRYHRGSYMNELSYTGNDYPFISSEDKSFDLLKETILADMFPEPSKYEAPLTGFEPAFSVHYAHRG